MDQLIPLVIDCTIVRLINTLTLQAQPQDENDELLSLPIPTPFQERVENQPLPEVYQTQFDSKEPTDQGESIFNTPLENIINFQQFLFLRPLIQKTIIVAGLR